MNKNRKKYSGVLNAFGSDYFNGNKSENFHLNLSHHERGANLNASLKDYTKTSSGHFLRFTIIQ